MEIATSNRDDKVNKLLGDSEGWHVGAITPRKDGPVYSLGHYAKTPQVRAAWIQSAVTVCNGR